LIEPSVGLLLRLILRWVVLVRLRRGLYDIAWLFFRGGGSEWVHVSDSLSGYPSTLRVDEYDVGTQSGFAAPASASTQLTGILLRCPLLRGHLQHALR
jgi:hypothetical protein